MKVFVTGASGFIGSAVVAELQRRGHKVVGLARSSASAEALAKAGASVHRGDIADPDSVVPALKNVDAVIHTAFNHDFSQYAENCASDGRLLAAMAEALVGTNKPLIATSGTNVTVGREFASEQDPASDQAPRGASEVFLNYADRGVRTAVVRLPPSVYGPGDTAFIPALIALARERGIAGYVQDGQNRWSAVHREDAARLFCDVLEQVQPGARYHGVGESGIAFRTIAEAISASVGVPVKQIADEQVDQHFGWPGMFARLDMSAVSDWTRETTGWSPKEAGLIDTMRGYQS